MHKVCVCGGGGGEENLNIHILIYIRFFLNIVNKSAVGKQIKMKATCFAAHEFLQE